jgi:GT2 family glycosyltransferase
MSVDVVIVDLDGGPMLIDCLRSVAAQSVRPDRVILVDNGSSTPTRLLVGGIDLPLIHVRLEENRGFTGGVNAAVPHLRSDFVALLNNDVTLDPRWLETMIERLQADVRLAAVQSWILGADGSVDGAGISIDRGRFIQRGHSTSVGDEALWPEVWGVSATAALYRREALVSAAVREGEIVDGRFFAYYEDVELSARLRAAGWALAVAPQPLATHLGSASRGRLGSRATFLQARNRHWVLSLHPSISSRGALLGEDLRELAASVRRLRFRDAVARIRGVAAALSRPLRRSG